MSEWSSHSKLKKEILNLSTIDPWSLVRISRKKVKYFWIIDNINTKKNLFDLLHLEPSNHYNQTEQHHKSQFTNGKIITYHPEHRKELIHTLESLQEKVIHKIKKTLKNNDKISQEERTHLEIFLSELQKINYKEIIASILHKRKVY